jgi:hypothetical protein
VRIRLSLDATKSGQEPGFGENEAVILLGFRLLGTFDTAGEVSEGYAGGACAISRANGGMRVCAGAVSTNHSPSRHPFSPTAVRLCPRRTRLRPMSRVRRQHGLRVPREIVPSIPARAYSA